MTNLFKESDETTKIIRQIDDAYIVWLADGNQYIRLEEPAFFVYESYENGWDRNSIANQCADRYEIQEEECMKFVTDILDGIEALKWTPTGKKSDYPDNQKLQSKSFLPFSIHTYSINGKFIQFQFETRLYEHYLHPLLKHLICQDSPEEFTLFEFFGYNNQVVLRVNDEVKGAWTEEETHLLKGMASLQILNVIYEKTDQDWMAIIHASAVTNGAKTMVFTASPGNGKSTMAALLQQKGYPIVSDDFVPIERNSLHIFPFPAAMSVKEGATELLSGMYPSLQEQKEPHQSLTNKMVRYLPVDGKALPAPVKEIIFIKYDPAVDFIMEKVPRLEALKILLDETWTSPSAINASRFLDWYNEISCYRLTYSNNEKAMQKIAELFEK